MKLIPSTLQCADPVKWWILLLVGFLLVYKMKDTIDEMGGILLEIAENDVYKDKFIQTNASIYAPKHILLWNPFFGDPSFSLEKTIGSSWNTVSGFSKMNCPTSYSSSCQMSANRSLLTSISEFDAIVFHLRDFSWRDVPKANSRSQNQAYVFISYEAPTWDTGRKRKIQKMQDYFNWSMTYRRDSIFYTPYGGFLKIREHPVGKKLESFIKEFGEKHRNLAQKKKDMDAKIVQIVSNCHSHSGRENIVKEIQKQIKIDIYGSCGPLSCQRVGGGDAGERCYHVMEERYKFYLALENSFCKDYVTEKFFEIAKYDMIPIVLNQAQMDQIAPTHSFINLADFRNISELVNYLHLVDKDDTLFASYFWWRKFYRVENRHTARHRSWCSLCSALHQQKTRNLNSEYLLSQQDYQSQLGSESVNDLQTFWVKQAHCEPFKF